MWDLPEWHILLIGLSATTLIRCLGASGCYGFRTSPEYVFAEHRLADGKKRQHTHPALER